MSTAKLTQNTREITPKTRVQDREKIKPIALNRRKLLENTRLSRLPSIAGRCHAAPERICAGWCRNMSEQNALDDLNVCADCLRIYAAVDQALSSRADRRAANLRREQMLEKWRKINL